MHIVGHESSKIQAWQQPNIIWERLLWTFELLVWIIFYAVLRKHPLKQSKFEFEFSFQIFIAIILGMDFVSVDAQVSVF